MAKKSVSDRLAKLKQKLENTDLGGFGDSGNRFWAPEEGTSVIRILPEVHDMEFFFQPVGLHFMPDQRRAYCPEFTSEGELECPICDFVNGLYRTNDPEMKALAGQIRTRKKYWMNVYVRDPKEGDHGPYIFTPGVVIFSAISNLISDPDYGEDVIDPYDGIDITIDRSGTGRSTEYDVRPKRRARPLVSLPDNPDEPDEDAIDKILDEASNIIWTEVGTDPNKDSELSQGMALYVVPYERLEDEFDLESLLDDVVGTVEEDEEEDEADEFYEEQVPRSRRRRRRRSR